MLDLSDEFGKGGNGLFGSCRCDVVYEYLGVHPVNTDSIQQYINWSDKYYTRSLIYKDESLK